MSTYSPPQAFRTYDPDDEVNVTGFTGSLGVFALTAALAAAAVQRRTGGLPDRYALADVLLGGLATHKFARLLSRGAVTSPLRAPFTRFEAPAGASEHRESPRGHGARHTVGELLTCPFCLAPWVSVGYVAGLAAAPRAARAWAAVFAVTAVSDTVQHGYARLRGD